MCRVVITLFLLLAACPLLAAPLSGTRSIGPTGDYPSLTAAIADVQTQTLGGSLLLELQPSYSSSVETFPLTFTNLSTTAAYTLTVRPQAGATALNITSGNTTAATVDLNGAQFVTLDGRPGGTGTVKELTLGNTSTSGVTVRFINEASRNTLRHLILQGVNTSASSGTVVFSTTTGANGNDNNKIDTCDICDGASTPTNGIYALGSSTVAQYNNGNNIINCNIFNFYRNFAVDVAGLVLLGGNTSWGIAGNSFYQTVSRAGVNARVRAIYLANAVDTTHNITGNYIGGSAPNAGGTPWTTTGTTQPYAFVGIWLHAATSTATTVQGNIIQNFAWSTSSTARTLPGIWTGVYVETGMANIGTVQGNTIGSATGTDSISVLSSGDGGITIGIGSTSTQTVAISKNTIGSITTRGTNTGIAASLFGIYVTEGQYTIAHNTLGSATTANSLNASSWSTDIWAQDVIGIQVTKSSIIPPPGNAAITSNTVANLNNNSSHVSSRMIGISASVGVNAITGNTVRNLSTYSGNTFLSAAGIYVTSDGGSQTITGNVVHSVACTQQTAAVTVAGICFDGYASPPNVIGQNLVHSLSLYSTNASAQMMGFYCAAGSFDAQNNMVRVGIDASGNSTAGAATVYGIYDTSASSGRKYRHNSVYVGGTQTSGTNNTFAFSANQQSGDTSNNVFVNARGNNGGTGRHYAVRYDLGQSASNNLYFVSGTGGVFGLYNGADRTSLADWQAATGKDDGSIYADPLYMNPTGDATTVNLHFQASTAAEGAGIDLGVTDDFDGQTRSSLSPVDMGADAGDFGLGLATPALGSGIPANRILTGWASIASPSGVSGGADAPRLYFKKPTEADVFDVANDSTGNGWKYVTASNDSSPYSFKVDYSLLTGGGVSAGDTIEYFVVAQDATGGFRSAPYGAVTTSSSVQNVSSAPTNGVESYGIIDTLSGTVTVGPGGSFPNLSGAGGLFAALNSRVLTSDLTVNVTGDMTEDGSTVLNGYLKNTDYPATANTFSVTLQPDSATMRTMSGSNSTGLIRLRGVQRLTVDGSFGGSGRYLTLRNTSSMGATILFYNDASNNIVRNCVIEGAPFNAAAGVVSFGTGASTGNDNNTVTGNQIRDRSDTTGVPGYLVYSSGTSSTVANSNNTISNNELFNFAGMGVFVQTGTESSSITGNTIYQTSMRTSSIYGIHFSGLGTNIIQDNIVRDLKTSNSAHGIYLLNQTGDTTVASNRLWNLGNTTGNTNPNYGIMLLPSADQNVTVVNNMIALTSPDTTAQNLYGILDEGAADSTVTIAHNTVLVTGTGSAGQDTWAFNRTGSSTATVENNIFLNLRTGGGNHFAANQPTSGTGPLTMDFNVYAGTGLTTAENFFDASNGSGVTGTPISYAQWQANVPGDTHSSAGNPGGNFSAAMFVDAANGDLHLLPGGNPLVNNTGTPTAGVSTDFDGDIRSLTHPYVGADEAVGPEIVLEQPALTALVDGASSLDLGAVELGSSGAATTFTVRNIGNADLNLGGINSNSGDFAVNTTTTAATIAAGSSTTFTVTFAPTAEGRGVAALQIGNNDADEASFDIALAGIGYITLANWRQQYFGTPSNTGNAADDFDFDHDGLPNLVEWATNRNPTTPGALPAAVSVNGDVLEFHYRRSLSAMSAGAVFTVEWSDTLAGNDWQTAGVTESVLSDDGTVQQMRAQAPAGGMGRRFMRLKVSTGP